MYVSVLSVRVPVTLRPSAAPESDRHSWMVSRVRRVRMSLRPSAAPEGDRHDTPLPRLAEGLRVATLGRPGGRPPPERTPGGRPQCGVATLGRPGGRPPQEPSLPPVPCMTMLRLSVAPEGDRHVRAGGVVVWTETAVATLGCPGGRPPPAMMPATVRHRVRLRPLVAPEGDRHLHSAGRIRRTTCRCDPRPPGGRPPRVEEDGGHGQRPGVANLGRPGGRPPPVRGGALGERRHGVAILGRPGGRPPPPPTGRSWRRTRTGCDSRPPWRAAATQPRADVDDRRHVVGIRGRHEGRPPGRLPCPGGRPSRPGSAGRSPCASCDPRPTGGRPPLATSGGWWAAHWSLRPSAALEYDRHTSTTD